MPDPSGNGGRGDWLFGGMRLADRADAAFRHFQTVLGHLAGFYDATETRDPVKQQEVAAGGLRTLRDLPRALMLDEFLRTRLLHLLGAWPAEGSTEDAVNLHAIQELHAVLDWLAGITPLDSVLAGQADLKRLEQRHRPRLFIRDAYVDLRTRDHTEQVDRAFVVLLTVYLAAKWDEKVPHLLRRLGLGQDDERFKKLAKEVPLDQRHLIREAGELDRSGAGLSIERQQLLSKPARAVLSRHDPELFPSLAGLDDEEILRKAFARVSRTGVFRRPKPRAS